MDHLQAAAKAKRNANVMGKLGNAKMQKAFHSLAKFHENEYAREYEESARAAHFDDMEQEGIFAAELREAYEANPPNFKFKAVG